VRALIVDDEPLARARLQRLLKPHDDVTVIAQAGDGITALQLISDLRPELVFMDVQMPESSGFDVAASLPSPMPILVFVTAHDAYALRAFEAHAIDYLLKPVSPERLSRALEKVRRILPAQQRTEGPSRQPIHAAERLLIPDRGRTHIVSIAEIEALQAADNYVNLITPSRNYLLRKTLAHLLADLGSGFVRIHRSHAIALAHVQDVQGREKGDALVTLKSGAQLPCSRHFRAGLVAGLASQT
jgi:two-component system, LytTR family, response regulator